MNQIISHRWTKAGPSDPDWDQLVELSRCSSSKPILPTPRLRVIPPETFSDTVIEMMLEIPGLTREKILQSVKDCCYNHVSALYQLLLQIEASGTLGNVRRPLSIPPLRRGPSPDRLTPDAGLERQVLCKVSSSSDFSTFSEQRPLLTSSRTSLHVPEWVIDNQMVEKFGDDGAESDVEDQPHAQCNRHLTTRRHTVGPGDTFNEDVMGHPLQELNVDNPVEAAIPKLSIIPNMNLPMNIPLLQGLATENFSVKNQHLLRPPPYMGASEYRQSP